VIVVLDPGCPHTVAMVERLVEFRRVHPEIPIRLLAAALNTFARAPEAALAAFQEAELTLEWDPDALRTLRVTRTPTVAVVDHTGRGIRATGPADLMALIEAAGKP